MTQEHKKQRCCPACNFVKARAFGQKNGFLMVSCGRCGTQFTGTLPDAASEHDYDAYYGTENLVTSDFISTRLDEIIGTFSHYRQNNRLLDVGCGGGALLQAARRAGWDSEGMEVSLPAVEHVRHLGFNVFHGDLAQANYPSGHFDVVTAAEVLEHIADPLKLMQEVARILRPGGLFWATTPHGCGLSARLIGVEWSVVSPPEHLQLFSVRGIKELAKEAGFSQTQTATHGLNPYEIVNALPIRRAGKSKDAGHDTFNRVESSHNLNERLTKGPAQRLVKETLNQVLNISFLGDSLKIRATR